jgi:hypothetical protein
MQRLACNYVYFLPHFPLERLFRFVDFCSAVDFEDFHVSLYVFKPFIDLGLQFQLLFFQRGEASGPGLDPGLGRGYLQLVKTIETTRAGADERLD